MDTYHHNMLLSECTQKNEFSWPKISSRYTIIRIWPTYQLLPLRTGLNDVIRPQQTDQLRTSTTKGGRVTQRETFTQKTLDANSRLSLACGSGIAGFGCFVLAFSGMGANYFLHLSGFSGLEQMGATACVTAPPTTLRPTVAQWWVQSIIFAPTPFPESWLRCAQLNNLGCALNDNHSMFVFLLTNILKCVITGINYWITTFKY